MLSLPLGLNLRGKKKKEKKKKNRRESASRREGDVELELKEGGEGGALFQAFYDATQLLKLDLSTRGDLPK